MFSPDSDSDSSPQRPGIESYAHGLATENYGTSSSESSDNEDDLQEKRKRDFDKSHVFAKKQKLDSSNYEQKPVFSEQSRRMMNMMNYDEKKGLGRSGQGRMDIVQISTQKGRRGLGLKLEGLDSAASSWNESMENLNIPEKVHWLENNDEGDLSDLTGDLLESWVKRGSPKMVIDDESKFCRQSVLQKVLECKTAFDNLGGVDMRKARARSNPFETIKSNIFMNRAAVKMANMDAMFDYMFTNPVDENGSSLIRNDDLLYFADVCAGPGGFSEYFLWRKKWQAKGFGFTLKGENDFKLGDFIAGSPETFDPYYGPKDNGDIFDPVNIEGFTDYVLKQTECGVHIMMADGGFSVEKCENIQEILSKQLYLCQILMALNIVRTDGHFVVKLFDLFTPFSVGLIYLVYKCFKKISICKPNTSRPANSERYLVCKWKKPGTGTIQRHLFEVNEFLFRNKNKNIDILELVPYDVLKNDDIFFQYMYDRNNEFGENQIVGLLKIAAFCANTTLNETKQDEIKRQCLRLWKLEDSFRKLSPKLAPDQYVGELLKEWSNQREFLAAQGMKLHGTILDKFFPSVHGWYFVPLDNNEDLGRKYLRTFFLGKGSKEVLYYNSAQNSWVPYKDMQLELSPRTLVYGEIVTELKGEGNSQVMITAFHIIDGIALGGDDIRKLPLPERIRMCEKYAKALNKPYRVINKSDSSYVFSMPIRCKKLFSLANINNFFDRLESYKLKGARKSRLGYHLRNTNEADRFFVPRALLFLNEVRVDYLKTFSKTHNKFYYYHIPSRKSLFPEQLARADEVVASFKNTYVHRVIWEWYDERQVTEDEKIVEKSDLTCRVDFKQFLINRTGK